MHGAYIAAEFEHLDRHQRTNVIVWLFVYHESGGEGVVAGAPRSEADAGAEVVVGEVSAKIRRNQVFQAEP